MFFIGGITQGTKELVYTAAAMICGRCGRYGRYQVFMTYMSSPPRYKPALLSPE